MTAFLDKKRWQEVFAQYWITDIAIQERHILQMCGRQRMSQEAASQVWDADIPARLITLFTDRPEGNNCGFQELEGMHYPVVGVARAPFPRPSGLLSSRNADGDVWPRGGGSGPMEQIDKGKWPGPQRLKCIDAVTYAVCGGRDLYRRVEVGRWEPFRDGLPQAEATSALGFSDMDAFSPSDMYAVGGHGDVWHHDGTAWRQMGFPSNVRLATVTCAGDGNVYISGEGGSLWVGEKSTWRQLYQGGSSVLWNDVLWFGGQLWLASDYQFRVWDGKALEPVMSEGKSVPVAGHMDAFDGILVIAGPEHVLRFDGAGWSELVAPYL